MLPSPGSVRTEFELPGGQLRSKTGNWLQHAPVRHLFESSCGSLPTFDFHFGGKLGFGLLGVRLNTPFQITVALLQNIYDLGIEGFAGLCLAGAS